MKKINIAQNNTIKKITNTYGFIVSKLNFPTSYDKISLILYSLVAFIAFFISVEGRYIQYDQWKDNKEQFFYENTPMMTTLDAYKYTRHAKEINAGEYIPAGNDVNIFYPEGVPFYDPAPLLSVILAKLHNMLGIDYYNIAINMVPWLSSIFILVVCAYFYLIGYPAIGAIVGLLTSFAPVFLIRTSIGRFDTDGGNMFFLFLAGLFIYLAGSHSKKYSVYIFTALLGFTILGFQHFYNHILFNLVYFVILILFLFVSKIKPKEILISAVIYIVASNPLAFIQSLNSLIGSLAVYIPFLPNNLETNSPIPWVYNTISEAAAESFQGIVAFTTGNAISFIVGLILAIFFLMANIKKSLPILPIFLMGLVVFVSSGRFAMFLMPFIALGFGYGLYIISHYLINSFEKRENKKALYSKLLPAVFSFFMLVILLTTNGMAFSFTPRPSIDTIVYSDISKLKEKLPSDSTIYTWWDLGLAITDITGFPVYHSGMSQSTPKTWMIANSLTGNQQNLYNIASYIEQGGYDEVDKMFKDNKSVAEVTSIMENYNLGPSKEHNYILFTNDMIGKYGAFAYFAQKDESIIPVVCSKSNRENIIICSNQMSVDLSQGVIYTSNNNIPLSSITYTQNGKKANMKTFSLVDNIALIIDTTSDMYLTYIMPTSMLNNAFVKLFLLQEYNKDLFTKVYDNYPNSIVYEINMKK